MPCCRRVFNQKPDFSGQFKRIIKRFKKVGFNLDIMRKSACLELSSRLNDEPDVKLLSVGW